MTAVDLSAADVLGRAADRLEKRVAQVELVSPSPWTWDEEQEVLGPDHADGSMRGVSESVFEDVSAFQALMDPHVVAALVPVLQMAAELAGLGYAGGEDPRAAGMLIALLHTVARRVLREEADAPAGTVTVEAAGRLVDVPARPLAHGQPEEEPGG